jgi:glucose-1-phosphate adenylyltransferase
MNDCIAVILGGGRGTRLFPLTRQRSKPAVPIGGKYRLIDIPVSNCLNSNLRRIFVLTQYNSESLNKHVSMTYKFDIFSSGFVTTLAAEQTDDSPEWFQGTADAVRQSMRHLRSHRSREVLILSGDQLYQMDFRKMLETHRRHVADATVAVIPVPAEQTAAFGILKVNRQGRIVHFEEKPKPRTGWPSSSPTSRATAAASSPRWASTCSRARRSRRSIADPSSSTSGGT